MTKAPSDTWVVAVCRQSAKDCDLPNKIKMGNPTKDRPVHLPRPEVRDIFKVRQSRNSLYYRSKTEVSHDAFTQCVESVRCLIAKPTLHPYFSSGSCDDYQTELENLTNSEFF